MLRSVCFAVLVVAGCSTRALEVPSAAPIAGTGTDAGTVFPVEPTCTGHAITTLVPDTGTNAGSVEFAVAAGELYYPDSFASIFALSTHGGAARQIATAQTQFVTVSGNDLYYSIDGCNGQPGCPSIVDLDLTTSASTSYPTPSFTFAVVPTPTALFAFSQEDVLRVTRATGAVMDTEFTTAAELPPVVLGTHAFYADANYATWRLDLSSNALDTILPGVEVTSLAADDTELAAATQNAFVLVEESGQITTTYPHASALVESFAVDNAAVYWSDFEGTGTLEVLQRATQTTCAIPLPGVRVIALAQDSEAVYAVIAADESNATTPLVRIEK